MTRINIKFTRATLLAISGWLAMSFSLSSHAQDNELQVGRYQSVMLEPADEQIDLLSHIVQIELPKQMNTIGQAISHILDGSGYRLLSPKLAESYRSHLFAMPLPEVQRQLGPLSLRQVLRLLGGPAFCLVIEPTYRLMSFELIKTTSDVHACAYP